MNANNKSNEAHILLLTKYLNNECTRQELLKVAELLTNPTKQEQLPEIFEQASKKFHGHLETSREHQEKSWSKIHAELSGAVSLKAIGKSRPKPIWLKIAASIIILIGVGLFVGKYVYDSGNTTNEVAVQIKTVHNALGKRSRLTLPDGSTVIMNSGTIITYPEHFVSEIRSVSLQGEAYFDVKENSSQPFVVSAQGLKTKVLGTTFNIRAYSYYDNVKVSLTSGKIAMQLPNASNEVILAPGQEVIYDLEANDYALNEFDSEQVLGWQNGILYFNEASEEQVINILEHWYDVKIQAINAPSDNWKNLTAKFDNQSLENVLISLGYTLDFNHEIKGKEVRIIYK